MADNSNDLSGKVGLDTTDFKAGITDLNRQIRVAESGFKAAAAGMESWALSEQGLEAKIKSLSTVTDLQKQKVANLTTEYKRIAAEYGEDSSAAQTLLIKINNQTAALNKNELELEQNKTALANFGKELTETASKSDLAKAKIEGFTKNLNSFGKGATSAGTSLLPVTATIGAAGAAAIKFGSDYNESLNKVDVAFKENSSTVEAWSKTTLDSFGIASGTALDMAALFGDMSTSMGFTTSKAAEMSTSLVGLAGDLASFKNISLSEASTALKSIFTGETESLKNLGIVMTEANLKAFAMSEGMRKNYKDMSEAEKVTLRYNYVLEKTKNSQGDFANTSDGTANSLRTMQESAKELGVAFSEELLPTITPIIQGATKLIKSFTELDSGQKKTIVTVGLLTAGVAPALIVVGKMATGVSALTTAFTAVKGAISKKIQTTTTDTGATIANTAATSANTAANVANAASVKAAASAQATSSGKTTALAIVNNIATTSLTKFGSTALVAGGSATAMATSTGGAGVAVGGLTAALGPLALILGTGIVLFAEFKIADEILNGEFNALIKTIDNQRNSLISLQTTRKETLATSLTEIDYTKKLWTELQTLVDKQGNIIGSKERVAFITNQINEAYPNTIGWVNSEKIAYVEGKEAIEKMIEVKRAQLVLDSYEAQYKKSLSEYQKAQNTEARLTIDIAQKQQEIDEKGYIKGSLARMNQEREMKKLTDAYKENQGNLTTYYSTMSWYEGLASKIAQGDTKAMEQYTSGLNNTLKTASKSTKDELAKQVEDTAANYANLKFELSNGTKGVTQSMVDNAKETATKAWNEYYKVGTRTADGFLSGFEQSKAKTYKDVQDWANQLVKTANKALDINSPSGKFEDTGEYSGQGFDLGFTKSMKTALKNAESTINTGISGLNAQTINTPTFNNSSSGSKSLSTTQGGSSSTIVKQSIAVNVQADDFQQAADFFKMLEGLTQIQNAGEVPV